MINIGRLGNSIKGYFWPNSATPTEIEESLLREVEGLEARD